MARKRTGLSNRFRSGRSTYSVRHKQRVADRYGQFRDGKCEDVIAGHRIEYRSMAGGK